VPLNSASVSTMLRSERIFEEIPLAVLLRQCRHDGLDECSAGFSLRSCIRNKLEQRHEIVAERDDVLTLAP